MDLNFNLEKVRDYTNKSQVARVLTEHWVHENIYCPNCGENHLKDFENNKPVADFYCSSCADQFELKSKAANKIGNKVVDGAYSTMINRIQSSENPHFFFLTYNRLRWKVNNFIIIPKHYFTPNIIEKRKALSIKARRSGWVGCNINLKHIPSSGRIFIIKDSIPIQKEIVHQKWMATAFLRYKKAEAKSWIIDIMRCVDSIPNDIFSLNEIYDFEIELKEKHPQNNFIKDKIRQQLQILRDKGFVEFKQPGVYRKIQL